MGGRVDRYNSILMFLLLLVAETITLEREEINVLEKNVNKRDLPVTVLSFSVYRVTVHCTHITISSTCMSLYLTLTKPFRRSKYIDIVTVFVSTNSSSFPMNDTAKNEQNEHSVLSRNYMQVKIFTN